ncbi:MAG: hypothetical protein ACOVO2_18065 [Emticicia sp.]|uniref:hypothetical protein n=1 Tax=Emticicia sp. TaxID=1930953 RepID=UPI003BA7BDE7
MKKYVMLAITAAILNVCVVNVGVANTPNLVVIQEETPEAEILLDKAIEAEAAGNQEALLSSLTAGTAALEKEANADKGSFKDKLLGQVGALQKFAPMVKSGLLKGDMLKKVINTVKMLLAAKRIENALGGSNLLGNVGGLTKNLGLMKAGLPALGGDSQSKLGGLLDTAMGSVGNLSKGGMTAKAAEPAVKKQLGGILDFVKGAI